MYAVYRYDDGKPYITPVHVVGKATEADLALVTLCYELPAVEIADSIPAEGTPVYCYGFGGTDPDNTTKPAAKSGRIASNFMRYGNSWLTFHDVTRHTIPIIQGDSGSGLFNSNGELVGVTHGVEDETGIAQAVRIDTVQSFTLTTVQRHQRFPRLHARLSKKPAAPAAPKVPAAPAAPVTPPAAPSFQAGGCPGGKCPAPQSRRGFIFRR